jgi:phospholipid N-methyltransferase
LLEHRRHYAKIAAMPDLDSTLHVNMLKESYALGQQARDGLYGIQWGDPETRPALQHVRDHFVLPYVRPDHTALEIGPGGGRWTRYMLGFKKLWAVDYHQELLDELARNFPQPNISRVKNNGNDFPGIPAGSVDFAFSFGVFVHLTIDLHQAYLQSLRPVLKKSANVIIQFADFDKKVARDNPNFVENNPRMMRAMVEEAGYAVLEEDASLWHSAMIRFGLPATGRTKAAKVKA